MTIHASSSNFPNLPIKYYRVNAALVACSQREIKWTTRGQ